MTFNTPLAHTTRITLSRGSDRVAIQNEVTQNFGGAQFWRFSVNGSSLQLYINGVLNASTTQGLALAGNTAPLYIGQFGGNVDQMSGAIDEVRIYNRALTQVQIQSDMNSPL